MSSRRAAALASRLSQPYGAWREAIRAMRPADATELVAELHDAWIAGELGPSLFQGEEVPALEVERRFGRLFAALPEAITAGLVASRFAESETDVRRWCWAPGWTLMEQDEDLLLMDDANVLPLLDEVEAGCPKSTYAVEIVAHHVRDHAHHALFQGQPEFEQRLALASPWALAARRAGASELASYLERLASYRARGKVKIEDVEQRVYDLRRCHANRNERPVITSSGKDFVAVLARANVLPGWLVVRAGTGEMWATEESPKR